MRIARRYVDNYGTQYQPDYDKMAFNLNKTDDNGNTLLLVACQNGNEKIAQLAWKKGGNPNHQNGQGHTALHFAMTYGFFELGAWLTDADKGAGADDSITNKNNLTPYDGLE